MLPTVGPESGNNAANTYKLHQQLGNTADNDIIYYDSSLAFMKNVQNWLQ